MSLCMNRRLVSKCYRPMCLGLFWGIRIQLDGSLPKNITIVFDSSLINDESKIITTTSQEYYTKLEHHPHGHRP